MVNKNRDLYKELLMLLVSYDCVDYKGKKQEPIITHRDIPIYKKVFKALGLKDGMGLSDFFKEMEF